MSNKVYKRKVTKHILNGEIIVMDKHFVKSKTQAYIDLIRPFTLLAPIINGF